MPLTAVLVFDGLKVAIGRMKEEKEWGEGEGDDPIYILDKIKSKLQSDGKEDFNFDGAGWDIPYPNPIEHQCPFSIQPQCKSL